MLDYLTIYTNLSLTITMILTLLVYSVGLMQFLILLAKQRCPALVKAYMHYIKED